MAQPARKRKTKHKPARTATRSQLAEDRRVGTNFNRPAEGLGEGAGSSISTKEFVAWAATLLILYSFIATWGQFDFSNLMGYYSMLADALLSGRLSISYTPGEVHLIDMVPFEGRYYLQWGPVPALFHLIVKIGGGELTDRVACILAGWLASLAFLRITLAIRGRYFPHLPLWICRAFFLSFALGSPTAFVSLRGTIYHESIGIAAMFVVLGFLFLLRHTARPSLGTSFLCGIFIAMAVGTRVTSVIYAGVFFLGMAALERHWRPGLKTSAQRLLAFSVPVALVCGMLLTYNQARFGSPWEYGVSYMDDPLQQAAGFDVRRMPRNFLHYVAAPILLQAELPWIINDGWAPGTRPPGITYRTEGMASMLLVTPFLLFGFWIFRLWRGGGAYPKELTIFGAATGSAGVLSFLLLLSFSDTSRRYMQDFVPALLIAAFIGAGLWQRGKASVSLWRWPAAAALVFSGILHIHLSFTQPFFTPPPDPSAMKAFVKWGPLARAWFDWPELANDEAIVRNDLGVHYLRERRHAAALEQFEVASKLLPGSPVVEKNLTLTRALLRQAR